MGMHQVFYKNHFIDSFVDHIDTFIITWWIIYLIFAM